MKWRKFIVFIITILSISVVVFNNLTDVIEKVFTPIINLNIFIGFMIAILSVIIYAIVNKDMLN